MDLGSFLDFFFPFFCFTPRFGIVELVWVGYGILVLLDESRIFGRESVMSLMTL